MINKSERLFPIILSIAATISITTANVPARAQITQPCNCAASTPAEREASALDMCLAGRWQLQQAEFLQSIGNNVESKIGWQPQFEMAGTLEVLFSHDRRALVSWKSVEITAKLESTDADGRSTPRPLTFQINGTNEASYVAIEDGAKTRACVCNEQMAIDADFDGWQWVEGPVMIPIFPLLPLIPLQVARQHQENQRIVTEMMDSIGTAVGRFFDRFASSIACSENEFTTSVIKSTVPVAMSFNLIERTDSESEAAQCSDEELSDLFGVAIGNGRNDLNGFDGQFAGQTGLRFKSLIEGVAQEAGLNPGCLAINALSETGNNRPWLSQGAVDSVHIGLDGWRRQRSIVGQGIPDQSVTDLQHPNCNKVVDNRVCHFVNEQGVDTGPMYEFPSARDGLRAMAAWLNELDRRLGAHVGGAAWTRLPESVRCALIRFSYNPGRNPRPSQFERAQNAVAAVDEGESALRAIPTDSPIRGSRSPARTSSARAAQAAHLSTTVFGIPVECP